MRYIKRILLILFLVIMISGCSVEYKVKINNDLSVNDIVYVSETTDRLKSRTNMDVNQSVKYLYDIYKFKDMGDSDYSITSTSLTTRVAASNSYKDLEDFSNKYRCDITDKPLYYETKDTIHFEIAQTRYIDTKASTRLIYDSIDYTVEVPFKVTYHNADKVDGNIYSWHIKPDDTNLRRMIIEFNPGKTESEVSFMFGKKTVKVSYWWIFLIIFILIIFILILSAYIRNKKNNKF